MAKPMVADASNVDGLTGHWTVQPGDMMQDDFIAFQQTRFTNTVASQVFQMNQNRPASLAGPRMWMEEIWFYKEGAMLVIWLGKQPTRLELREQSSQRMVFVGPAARVTYTWNQSGLAVERKGTFGAVELNERRSYAHRRALPKRP